MNVGLHIIGDLYECDFSKNITHSEIPVVINTIGESIVDAGLTIVGTTYHIFGNDSFTIAYLLAESHITIHTWPERNYISLDIFVCNYEKDNSAIGEHIFTYLVDFFASARVIKQEITR